jgi:magnesium transporter
VKAAIPGIPYYNGRHERKGDSFVKRLKITKTDTFRPRPYLRTAGLPPGSLVHTGEVKSDRSSIMLTTFSPDVYSRTEIGVDALPGPDSDDSTVQWLDVSGLHDIDMLEAVGNRFGLHRLVMEDILNTGQRPKLEDYGSYIYTVVKVLSYDVEAGEFSTEQESLVLGHGFVLTFGEQRTDIFKPIVDRLANDVGRMRKMGEDYLLYCLLDIIADDYFVVLEDIGEKIEYAEDQLVTKPTNDTLKDIYGLKRSMLYLHKAVWPFREVVGALERGETKLVQDSTNVFLRDLYDHVIQVMDMSDTMRDILSSMLDIYLSSASNRMNEIMKVLTIISTVFIPLTFIVGVYGMNLHMPEINYPWMYPAVWSVMIAIAVVMLYYFKRKKWW